MRPCTPKCAPEETALLVPLSGPNRPIGARISAPSVTLQQDRPQPGLEGQPEEHRKAAEHGGGEGIGAAEDHAEQIDRRGVAFVVGNLFDPEGFDACDCVLVIVVIHDVLPGELASRWQVLRHRRQVLMAGQPTAFLLF